MSELTPTMPTRSRNVLIASTCVLVCFGAITCGAEPPPTFTAGFAERDITPAIGMEQPGGYRKTLHRSIHDPCKVRVAVFDDGQTRVAIVGLDALLLHRPSVVKARQGIEKKCGIPGAHVLISASHSHSSGPTGMALPGQFDDAPPLVQRLAYEETSCANADYLRHVEDQIVAAVCAADAARAPAKAGVGKGIEDQVAFNRRFRMRSGLTATHPRQGNPEIVEVAGPTDPEVGVIGVWNKSDKLLGCIVNFACHATTRPGGASANYIYYLEQTIRGAMGSEAVVVFLPGDCGDITQVDNLDPLVLRKGETSAHFVGGRVGAEAVKVMLSMERGPLVPLATRSTMLNIPRRVPKPERVEQCTKIAEKPPSGDLTEWTFAKEIVLLDWMAKKEPVVPVEIQVVQVGPAIFITNPAEFFCEFGLQTKRDSPFPFTFPVELADGCVGYVPTEDALGPRGGGYETRLTSYSNLEPAAGRKFVEAGVALARQLAPGSVPERPKAAPFKQDAWGYGNVPPELD